MKLKMLLLESTVKKRQAMVWEKMYVIYLARTVKRSYDSVARCEFHFLNGQKDVNEYSTK